VAGVSAGITDLWERHCQRSSEDLDEGVEEIVREENRCQQEGRLSTIAHDEKECSQIFVIATRLEDCRHLHFRERYNGRLIVINGRSQGSCDSP
jgi:hypothetical protein